MIFSLLLVFSCLIMICSFYFFLLDICWDSWVHIFTFHQTWKIATIIFFFLFLLSFIYDSPFVRMLARFTDALLNLFIIFCSFNTCFSPGSQERRWDQLLREPLLPCRWKVSFLLAAGSDSSLSGKGGKSLQVLSI